MYRWLFNVFDEKQCQQSNLLRPTTTRRFTVPYFLILYFSIFKRCLDQSAKRNHQRPANHPHGPANYDHRSPNYYQGSTNYTHWTYNYHQARIRWLSGLAGRWSYREWCIQYHPISVSWRPGGLLSDKYEVQKGMDSKFALLSYNLLCSLIIPCEIVTPFEKRIWRKRILGNLICTLCLPFGVSWRFGARSRQNLSHAWPVLPGI